jgi:quinol monooxygenase YgiN
MSFIQIIDYETDHAAEIDAKMREGMEEAGVAGFVRLEHTQDHDNPRHFMTIVEFDSYEEAMENSSRPETDQMARELAALCSAGPSFSNLDVKLHVP